MSMPTPADYFARVAAGDWRNRAFANFDAAPNFQQSEFACPCGLCKLDGRQMDHALVLTLQRVRDLLGHGVRVSSGVRCPDHNRAVDGARHSAHLYGRAADLALGDGNDVYRVVVSLAAGGDATGLGFRQHGGARRFVHIDNCQPGEFGFIARPRVWTYA